MSQEDLLGDLSTFDDGTRSPLDFYETPAWMTRSLLHNHPFPAPHLRVLECCAGRGAITRELERAGMTVVENDINPAHHRRYQLDMTSRESWLALDAREGPFDYVISNLPFNIAIAILRAGIDIPRRAFMTVLLKSFDEPTFDDTNGRLPRAEWLEQHPWTRKINQPRHKFRGTGSPSMASDWFIWERERDVSLAPCIVDATAKRR